MPGVKTLEEGQRVMFTRDQGPKGPQAISVQSSEEIPTEVVLPKADSKPPISGKVMESEDIEELDTQGVKQDLHLVKRSLSKM